MERKHKRPSGWALSTTAIATKAMKQRFSNVTLNQTRVGRKEEPRKVCGVSTIGVGVPDTDRSSVWAE